MTDFYNYNLPTTLLKSIERMQFKTPTPIQAKAIPIALQGRDIIGSAHTGTGKTAAFSIPIAASLINLPDSAALILTPTRELAIQVMDVIQKLLSTQGNIKGALLIGGEPIFKQFKQLKARSRIIVGTPGRVNDHLRRKSLKLNNTNLLVLDETDRMLDIGFGEDLEDIISCMPQKRQTLMFSATLPPNILRLSEKYMHNPERISMGSINTLSPNIKQEIIHTSEANKYGELVKELTSRNGSILVFVGTKKKAGTIAQKLNKQNYRVGVMHGDLDQRKRQRTIKDFRDKKFSIIVATDVASRGLDIPHIEHVINYDLPHSPEDYIHRAGRTARAGAEGVSLSFIAPEDGRKWKDITRLLNPNQAQSPAANDSTKPKQKSKRNRYRWRGNKQRRG
jgi:superfamily II DNA/RNA helicase